MTNTEIIINALIRTGNILLKTVPLIFSTLFIADILIRMGWLNRLFRVIKPLINRTLLPPEVSAAFMAAFGSQVSGTVILKKLYKEKKISRGELLLSNQINALPIYIKEIFTHFIPVAIPILGVIPGVIYAACFFFVGIFRLIIVFIAGRIMQRKKRDNLSKDCGAASGFSELTKEKISRELIMDAFKKTLEHLKGISVLLLIITLLVSIADGFGIFNSMQDLMSPLIALFHIPEKMLVPALTYLGNTASANFMVGAMYKSGSVTWQAATLTVLAGSLLAMPVLFIRHTLARNIAIYGTRLGALNSSITLVINISGRIIFLTGFILITGG